MHLGNWASWGGENQIQIIQVGCSVVYSLDGSIGNDILLQLYTLYTYIDYKIFLFYVVFWFYPNYKFIVSFSFLSVLAQC